MNREHIKYAIIGIAIILSAYLLGRAYTYKYRSQDTVVVTGLGETEFESDLIVWSGVLTAEAAEAADGYRPDRTEQAQGQRLPRSEGDRREAGRMELRQRRQDLPNRIQRQRQLCRTTFHGVLAAAGVQHRIDGRRSGGERLARNLGAHRAGRIDRGAPARLLLYETRRREAVAHRTRFGRRTARAEKIAQNAGTGIGAVASARMGVFQITGANANEEFSAGGSFNTASRHKKARITMRIEYRIK